MNRTRRILIVLLAGLTGCGGGAADDSVPVVVSAPVSTEPWIARSIQQGAQLAVDDINAHGGLPGGQKMQLLQFDSKLSAQESQSALQAAIDQGARAGAEVACGGGRNCFHRAVKREIAAERANVREPGGIAPGKNGHAREANFARLRFA